MSTKYKAAIEREQSDTRIDSAEREQARPKFKLRITGECKQNMKLCKRRGLPMDELWTVVGKLLNGEQLDEKYQAHILTGDRKGQWECHIQPDWLLIWEIRNQELVLVLLNTGTHSDLFDKKYKKR